MVAKSALSILYNVQCIHAVYNALIPFGIMGVVSCMALALCMSPSSSNFTLCFKFIGRFNACECPK